MSFDLRLAPGAFRRLRGTVPESVKPCIERHLDVLAADPLSLGRRACFPFPERGQMYDFKCLDDGKTYFFVAFFRFDQDEKGIWVNDVTVSTLD